MAIMHLILPVVLLLHIFNVDSRLLKHESTLLDSNKDRSDPSKEAVETKISEMSDLLSKLRDYDEVNHHACLDLKYLNFSSIKVSSKCVKLYREPNCQGSPSEDQNAVVSIGKNKLSSCRNEHPPPVTSMDYVETSLIVPSHFGQNSSQYPMTSNGSTLDDASYDLSDDLPDVEFDPWKPTLENTGNNDTEEIITLPSTNKVAATVLIVNSNSTSSQFKTDPMLPGHRPIDVHPEKAQRQDESKLSCHEKCIATDPYGILWDVCLSGTGFRACPGDTQGNVVWQCGNDGQFIQPHPDYSQCHSNWISEAESSILRHPHHGGRPDLWRTTEIVLQNVNKAMPEGATLATRKPRYFGHEIPGILTLVERAGSAMDSNGIEAAEAIVSSSVIILDSVASESGTWNQLPPHDRAATGTQLIKTLESTMFGLAKAGRKFGKPHYDKSFTGSQNLKVRIGSVARSTSNDAQEFKGQEGDDPVIKLPSGWTSATGQNGDEIHFVQMSMTPECTKNIINNEPQEKRLNSKLATFSVANQDGSAPAKINFQEKGILITFPHETQASEGSVNIRRRLHADEQSTVVLGSALCVYWDTQTLNWSSKGCRLIESGKMSSTCECMHLTSFAVLMDTHQYVGKDLGIIVLTRLLCTMSCLCLLVTIIIFKRLHTVRNARSSVTIHLCFCLLVGNILILTLMDRDNFPLPNGLCAFVGMLSHFIFLSAFAWMGIEGFIVYKMVVDVFESGAENKIKLRLLAYGIPLAIVLTFLIIHISTDSSTYGGELYCWLQGNYIWSFIVPVMIICLVNMVVLVIALKTAFKKKNSTVQVKQSAKVSRTMIVGTLSLTCLLGLTWMFGFLLTIDNEAVAITGAYLFTILNASQGIFIFIFHCWMNKQVRVVLTRRVTAWHSTFVSTDNTKTGRNDERRRSEPSFLQADGPSEHTNTTLSTSVRTSQAEEKAGMLTGNGEPPPSETPC